MSNVKRMAPTYMSVLSYYMLATSDVEREVAMADATEVGKALLGDGPIIDRLFEMHRKAQQDLAQRWVGEHIAPPLKAARERLVYGDAIPLMLALMMPHEVEQRAHHERRWRRENAKLAAMFEQTDSLIIIYDADGNIDEVNPAFVRVTGWSALEAAMGKVKTWETPLPPDRTEHCQGEQLRSDGSTFLAQWSVSPIFGMDGKLLNHVCIGRDVTHAKKVEDSLRENDKLRAVATLAAGIAHDFNNLLGSIIGLAELCELEAPPGSRLARNLSRIHSAGDKAAVLVRQMLDFSRQTPKAAQRVDLSEFLEHAQGLLRAALPPRVQMQVEVTEDSAVHIDLVQFEQVLLNMAGNAAHAMRGRDGALTISADRADPEGWQPTAGTTPAGPSHARLRVADNGDGMPPEVVKKIFEPFFTTKPVGEGTGLGLAAAHGVVSSHGGVIEVASTQGVGTTFSIFLPLLAAEAAPDESPAASEGHEGTAQVPSAAAEKA